MVNRPAVVIPLMLAVNVFGAIGQTFIKRAVNAVPLGVGIGRTVLALLGNVNFYTGFLLTGTGVLTWLVTISRADLSYATPFASIGMVFVAFTSAFFLHEPVGAQRLAGTLIIAVGAFLVARS